MNKQESFRDKIIKLRGTYISINDEVELPRDEVELPRTELKGVELQNILDKYKYATVSNKTFNEMRNELDILFNQWHMCNIKYTIILTDVNSIELKGLDALSTYALKGIIAEV